MEGGKMPSVGVFVKSILMMMMMIKEKEEDITA